MLKKSTFKDFLRKEIKKYGYTQEEFADKIGIGHSTLKKYLSPKENVLPDVEILDRICTTLNLDADYIMGRMNFTSHAAQVVHELTGLSETSFIYLKKLNENTEADDNIKLSTLNQILTSTEFDILLHYITNARVAHTGFPIKYNQTYLSNITADEKTDVIKALSDNDDYIDSREYHASKALGNLFDEIIQIPMEDELMLYDYMDYYFERFAEHFPLEDFNSYADACIQIKECLLTCTPITSKKEKPNEKKY